MWSGKRKSYAGLKQITPSVLKLSSPVIELTVTTISEWSMFFAQPRGRIVLPKLHCSNEP
jgi:hypothetical protein